jgi:hypothetical protein
LKGPGERGPEPGICITGEERKIQMITGAHSIIYSTNPDADRAFFRDVLGLTHVDAGEGWLIFGLPPAEVAIHPSEKNDVHELYLICDDITLFASDTKKRGISCSAILDQGWGLITHVSLPGGGRLGVYQPRHPRPKSGTPSRRLKPRAAGTSKRRNGAAVRAKPRRKKRKG